MKMKEVKDNKFNVKYWEEDERWAENQTNILNSFLFNPNWWLLVNMYDENIK